MCLYYQSISTQLFYFIPELNVSMLVVIQLYLYYSLLGFCVSLFISSWKIQAIVTVALLRENYWGTGTICLYSIHMYIFNKCDRMGNVTTTPSHTCIRLCFITGIGYLRTLYTEI